MSVTINDTTSEKLNLPGSEKLDEGKFVFVYEVMKSRFRTLTVPGVIRIQFSVSEITIIKLSAIPALRNFYID